MKTRCSSSITLEKRSWADCEDELSDASTFVCDGRDSMSSTSEEESSQRISAAPPMLPPGQFSCNASATVCTQQFGFAAPANANAPMTMPLSNSQQVMLMPVLMNGVQVLMPVVAAQAWSSSPMPLRAAAEHTEVDDRTTLMLRNLPKSYSRTNLLRILDEEGFQSTYCFIYVPTNFKSLSGFGYAFVAFHSHEDAERAKARFHGYDWEVPGVQRCDVAWSGPVQGREQHVERYRNSPVMHESVPDEYKPAVFERGQRMPFPAPTKVIRPPQLRHGIAGAVLGPGAGDN
jgi:hypothetical protein